MSDGSSAPASGARSATPQSACVPTPTPAPIVSPGPLADAFTSRKDYFAAVAVLRESAWKSFERRVAVEWNFSFALWTALSAILAAVVTKQVTLSSSAERFSVGGVGAFAVALHIYWSIAMATSNNADLSKVYACEDEMRVALGWTDATKTGRRFDAIAAGKSKRNYTKHWGHVTQVAISVLLEAVVIATIWLRT